MKVEKIDYVWVILSWAVVALTYSKGCLSVGVLVIYALFAALMIYHISVVKKQMSGTMNAIGEITGYHTPERSKLYYPIVKFETEKGRTVTSVYTNADRERRYEIGDTETVCYDPLDPMFFFFADREDDLTSAYRSYLLYGGIAAIVLFIVVRAIFGG